jgi:hypothetical protein
MARPHPPFSTLLCAVLAAACPGTNPNDETQGAATSTTSTTSGNQSGSVTSAPGTATAEFASESASMTATAMTTGSESTNGATGGSCSFLPCVDMMPPLEECNNFLQDCPEGQKCAAYVPPGDNYWTAVKCVDVTGTDKPGELCSTADAGSGVDSCIKGAMCWEVNEDGVGICRALCTGNPDTPICDPPGSCTVGAYSTLNLCLPYCDPLLQDCVGMGDACYANDDYFICYQDASGEEGQAGDPCNLLTHCDPGLMCAFADRVGIGCAPDSLACCTPFCHFPDGACPNPDQQCVQYLDPMDLPPNDPQLDIGYCAVPG